jgi:hypothetical protein
MVSGTAIRYARREPGRTLTIDEPDAFFRHLFAYIGIHQPWIVTRDKGLREAFQTATRKADPCVEPNNKSAYLQFLASEATTQLAFFDGVAGQKTFHVIGSEVIDATMNLFRAYRAARAEYGSPARAAQAVQEYYRDPRIRLVKSKEADIADLLTRLLAA